MDSTDSKSEDDFKFIDLPLTSEMLHGQLNDQKEDSLSDRRAMDKHKNIYTSNLPIMNITGYEHVDPVIMFYLICLYHGIYRKLYITQEFQYDIPDVIKRQFSVKQDQNNLLLFESNSGKYYTNFFFILNAYAMEKSIISNCLDDQKDFIVKSSGIPFLLIKYTHQKEYTYRRVSANCSLNTLNTIKSILSRYGIFDFYLNTIPAQYDPDSRADSCLLRDTRLINIGYNAFCHIMGINMDTDLDVNIKTIFDREAKIQGFFKKYDDIISYTGQTKFAERVLKRISDGKLITFLPFFFEKDMKYNNNPMNITSDIAIMFYIKVTDDRNHACYLIHDKVSNNVLAYDPHGSLQNKMKPEALKLIFGTDVEVTENIVQGFQFYDKEGYCFYYSLMFMMIFVLVYSWSRIEPAILFNCIENTVYDIIRASGKNVSDILIRLIKQVAIRFQIMVEENIEVLYTPSNHTYTDFDFVMSKKNPKEPLSSPNTNMTYMLSWFLVSLNDVIRYIEKGNYKKYINKLIDTSENMELLWKVSTFQILEYIKDDDLHGILNTIYDILYDYDIFAGGVSYDRQAKKTHLSVYYYCLMVQLIKIYNRLSIRISKSYEDTPDYQYTSDETQKQTEELMEKIGGKKYSEYIFSNEHK